MNTKRTGTGNKRSSRESNAEIVFERMTYLVEDIHTVIGLLASPEYDIKLRALGTLSKYTSNDAFLNDLFSNGIYCYLVNLLDNTDVFILRFTLKIFTEILSNEKCLRELTFVEVFKCLDPVMELYLQNEDTVILECLSLIMIRLSKYNNLIIPHIFSKQLVARTFTLMKRPDDVDVQKNAVELFFYLLQKELVDEELFKSEAISVEALLCLLKCEIKEIKDIALNIFTKLSLWRNRNILIYLTEKKVNEAMVNLIMNDEIDYSEKALNIMTICMAIDECAVEFFKSFEFILFSEWVKICPDYAIEQCATILTILTRIPSLRQPIFDLSVEDAIISLFRYTNEPIYNSACEAVCNMTNHKYCCEKMMTPALIAMLLNMLQSETTSMSCREKIIKTLHNFLKRNVKTLRVLVKLNGYDILTSLFETSENQMSHLVYERLLEIIDVCCNSEYSEKVSTTQVYQVLFNLLKANRVTLKVLNLLNKLVTNEEFQQYFVEMRGSSLFLTVMENTTCPDVFTHILIVIQNMMMYKSIGFEFLETGLLAFLNSINPEIKEQVKLIDGIIEMLYSLCLSLKFFDSGRLEITDVIRDNFYLVRNDWYSKSASMETLSDLNSVVCKPIYIVNYAVLRKTCSAKESNSWSTVSTCESDTSTTHSKQSSMDDVELRCATLHLKQVYNTEQIPASYFVNKTMETNINYGAASDDPYLAEYVLELREVMWSSENPITTLEDRIQYLAEYVDRQLSGFEDTDDAKRRLHLFHVHLMTLRSKLGTNLTPIGYLRMGYHCERALLFKVLADNINVFVTLTKGDKSIFWNEVALTERACNDKEDACAQQTNQLLYFVVDLMENIGNLMPVGSIEANKYCHLREWEEPVLPELYENVI